MFSKKTIGIFFIFLLSCYATAYCQNSTEKEIERLKAQMSSDPPVQKVSTMLSLCYNYFSISADSALGYATKALNLSKQLKNDTLMGRAYLNIGHAYLVTGKDSLTILYLTKSADMFKKHADSAHLASAVLDIAQYYSLKGDYENSLKYNWITLNIYRKLNKPQFYENSLLAIYEIGNLYRIKKDFKEALQYYQYALKLADAHNDNGSRVSIIDISIGNIYLDWKQYRNAIEYYDKAYNISKDLGDKDDIGYTLNSIGNAFLELKSYDTSYYYCTKAANFSLKLMIW